MLEFARGERVVSQVAELRSKKKTQKIGLPSIILLINRKIAIQYVIRATSKWIVKVITQEKIAEDLELSFMTVYRCLSGNGSVSAKTRKRITDYIEKHNYHPNLMARSLVLQKSNIIGLLVPSVAYSFYPEIIESIQETLKQRGYNLLLCLSNEDPETEKKELEMLMTIPVDGILISPVSSEKSIEHCRILKKNRIPFVLFDRYFPKAKISCSYVATDSFAASMRIVEYLISLGHKKIAHIGGDKHNSFSKSVFEGYNAALKTHKIKLNKQLVVQQPLTEKGGYDGMKSLLGNGAEFTAVQAANDPMAIGIMNAAFEAGIKIPGQVSLTGFSDISIAGNLSVPLTTIKEPTSEMGKIAADILVDKIENKEQKRTSNIRRLLTGELVVRKSCAKPE